jgi:hypothetical protein
MQKNGAAGVTFVITPLAEFHGRNSTMVEEVMRSVGLMLCVAVWGASALAAPQKSDLSVDFSHAAVKYLMVVRNYESAAVESSSKAQGRINSAYEDMSLVATGDKTSPENLTALLLKIFAVTHMMNVKTYQLTGERNYVAKDETCISDWKQALQSQNSNQPETCK